MQRNMHVHHAHSRQLALTLGKRALQKLPTLPAACNITEWHLRGVTGVATFQTQARRLRTACARSARAPGAPLAALSPHTLPPCTKT